jgi:hypothetical protein
MEPKRRQRGDVRFVKCREQRVWRQLLNSVHSEVLTGNCEESLEIFQEFEIQFHVVARNDCYSAIFATSGEINRFVKEFGCFVGATKGNPLQRACSQPVCSVLFTSLSPIGQ